MNPTDVANGIREYTTASDIDIADMKEIQNIIYDVSGYILGLIVTVLCLGITVITALDICYITMPSFQEKVRNHNWDSGSTGKLRLVSNDARISVNKANTSSTGTSALKIYITSRIKTYMILAIVIYLSLGGIYGIIPLVVKIVRAIMSAFYVFIN